MRELWRAKRKYKHLDEEWFHISEILPYERLYETLTQEELQELLQDAKHFHWKVLDLHQCGLDYLPDSLGNLPDLQFLDIGNGSWGLADKYRYKRKNEYSQIPESIGKLTNLITLRVSVTSITNLPESIGNLSNLKYLSMWRTFISTLPDTIGKLKNLHELDLSYCHLSAIPYSLVQLGLPFRIDDFRADNCINLYGVTLDEGDLSLFAQPREVIEEYYRNRITEETSECKVIFLGDGAAGKSSLIERMVHDKFEDGTIPTDGVNMTRWTAYPDGKPLTLDGKPLVLRLMDFGGQEIMHAMHRCFLTAHTVYVVVCESRNDTDIDSVTRRWVETVRSFAPGCPVILALNKSDLNNHVTVNETDIKNSNPAFLRAIRTSAKNDGDHGVQQLIQAVFEAVPGCLSQMTGNKGFLGLKQELEAMEEDYILPDRFRERCEHFEIKESMRAGLLGWFRDLGVAYPYAVTFREVYVLNPAWLTNGIYRLILRTDSGGFLKHSAIRETLGTAYKGDVSDKTYTAQEMEFILHVMRQFEISRPVTPEYAQDGVEMIPLKMGKTPPKQAEAFLRGEALHLRWKARYLPNTLVHRLMIRKFEELDTGCVWRTGGRFHSAGGGLTGDGGCELLAEMSEDRVLDLYAVGSDARGYMDKYREQVLRILKELNIKAEEFVYCSVNGKLGRIPLAHVLALRKRGMGEIYLGDIDEFASIDWILRENYVPHTDQKNAEAETRDFFISYNNRNDEVSAQWIADTLRANGYTVYFQKYDCKPSMDFLTWMEHSITYSCGFIAVLSSGYEESDYCIRELHAAMTRQHGENYPILPVRVKNVPVKNPLLRAVNRVDLLDRGEEDRRKLLNAAEQIRTNPPTT